MCPALEKFTSSDTFNDFRLVAGCLYQTTSQNTGRYDASATVEPGYMSIKPGMFLALRESVPNYLPPQWSAFVHPEGQLYFFRQSALRTVTEAYLYHPDTMMKVTWWSKEIEDRLLERSFELSDDVELFLQIQGNDCAYYIVNHHTHTIFWMDEVNTDDLNISPAVSPSHLRLALNELYWNHVEHFPMHLNGLPPSVVNELVGVFSHALTDHMTSRSSTFPYTVSECTKFLELLKISRAQLDDGSITCLVARLWRLIFTHRFVTHYGEEHARLSRDQAILVDSARESRSLGFFTSVLSFKTSDAYLAQLNNIYTDQLVYVHQWQPFMSTCMKDWRRNSLLTMATLMLHLLFLFTSPSRCLLFISGTILSSGLVSSTILIHRHQLLEDSTATDAARYLSEIRSEKFKFQLVAFAYSLPRTLYYWGLATFFLNWLLAFSVFPGIGLVAVLSLACLCALVGIQQMVSQAGIRNKWSEPLAGLTESVDVSPV